MIVFLKQCKRSPEASLGKRNIELIIVELMAFIKTNTITNISFARVVSTSQVLKEFSPTLLLE